MAAKKAGVIWVDAQGEKALHVITTGTGVGPIEAALVAASNAVVTECWEGLDEFPIGTPSVAVYPTVRKTVVLNFVDGAGFIARLYLPAPNNSIFLSDGDTVDPTNTLVLAIIAAATAAGGLQSGGGNTVTAFTGGTMLPTRLSGISSLP